MHIAYLTAKRSARAGSQRDDWYLYDVSYLGEVVVSGSRSPECDLARVLLAKGITGRVTLLDAATATPRMVISIEGAVKLTVEENRKRMRFVKWCPFEAKPKPLAEAA
jgi:hypothetical protein